jgi:hypothetical protein
VSVFSDPEIVALLQTKFIPVAVDNHHIEKQRDAEGDFYRKVADRQGEYLCTPEGKLLGRTNTHSAAHLKGLLEKALRDFQPAEGAPAEGGKPDPRFSRALPEQGLVLSATTKVLGGYPDSGDRKIRIYQQSLGRDHLWLEKEDVQALVEGRVTDRLRNRIASYHLVDNTRGEPPWWRKGEIKSLELALSNGILTGKARFESESGDRGFAADLRGVVEVRDGKVTRFDLVAKGEAWGAGRWNGGQPSGKYPLAVAFALTDPKTDADRVLPQGACRGNFGGYFGP